MTLPATEDPQPKGLATQRSYAMRKISALVALCLLAMLVGCGNSNLTFPGEDVPTSTPGPGAATPTSTPAGDCAPGGAECFVDSDCCSGQCVSSDGVLFVCA
jgi:hypothetical protein